MIKLFKAEHGKLVLALDFLAVLCLILGAFIFAKPIYPEAEYYLDSPISNIRHALEFVGMPAESPRPDMEAIPAENHLFIPKIGVDGKVYEGDNSKLLYKGIWRLPNSQKPSQGGNTVIVAHRYLEKSGPNTFYLLDKIKKGDEVVLWWDKVRYNYQVTSAFEVNPDQIEIEDHSETSKLTLYTCTPLWSGSRRLVVLAEPIH